MVCIGSQEQSKPQCRVQEVEGGVQCTQEQTGPQCRDLTLQGSGICRGSADLSVGTLHCRVQAFAGVKRTHEQSGPEHFPRRSQ